MNGEMARTYADALQALVKKEPGWDISLQDSVRAWYGRAISAVVLLSKDAAPDYVSGALATDGGKLHLFYNRSIITVTATSDDP